MAIAIASGCGDGGETPAPAPPPAAAVEGREDALAAIDRLLEAQRIEEAARVATRLAQRHPGDASVALRLGRVRLAERSMAAVPPRSHSRDRRSSEAANALQRAIEGGIDDRETLVLAATLLEACGRGEEGEAIWRRLRARSPDDVEVALRLALNLDSGGRRAEGLEIAETTRDRHPDHPFAAVVLGELRLSAGDETGVDMIAEGVRLDPGNPAWRMRLAVWLRRLRRCEEAIALLAAMPAATAPQPATAREIAACWVALDRPEKAAAAWEAIAERSDDRATWVAEAWREATAHHLDAGDRDAAWRCLQRASIADPEHPELAALEQAVATPASAATSARGVSPPE